jgi:hypothetical protein
MNMTTLLVIGWLASTPSADPPGRVEVSQPALALTAPALLADNIVRVTPSIKLNLRLQSAASSTSTQFAAARRQRSTAQRIATSIFGAVGGFFLGGYTGASIEGQSCECDDPGFKGFVIGAPIGAVVGGILGAKW